MKRVRVDTKERILARMRNGWVLSQSISPDTRGQSLLTDFEGYSIPVGRFAVDNLERAGRIEVKFQDEHTKIYDLVER